MTKRDSRPIDVEPLVPAIIRTPSPSLDYCQNLRREGFIEPNQIDSVHSLRRADPSRRRGQMEGCLRLPPPLVVRDREACVPWLHCPCCGPILVLNGISFLCRV